MNAQQLTFSVALFCDPGEGQTVPLRWYENAIELFQQFHLEPILFTASGGGFEYDDCYVLAENGQDLFKFEELLIARRDDLILALQSGQVDFLGLDSPYRESLDRSDWRACITLWAWQGQMYMSLTTELLNDPVAFLRWALRIANTHCNVRYAFAYYMPLGQDPESYAVGGIKQSFSDILEMIHHRDTWEQRKKTPDELWDDELGDQRRHLTGLFRGAYPLNVLSEAHVQAANLHQESIGKLSELDAALYLWELSESEIPRAEDLLSRQGVLVSQAR